MGDNLQPQVANVVALFFAFEGRLERKMTETVYIVTVKHECTEEECTATDNKLLYATKKEAKKARAMLTLIDKKTTMHKALLSYLSNEKDSSDEK